MKRKLLASLLALAMVVSLLPMSALAADGNDNDTDSTAKNTISMTVGESRTLNGTDGDRWYSHSWSSNYPEIVTVSDSSNTSQTTLTAIKAGNATITHTYYEWNWPGGYQEQTETYTVTVATSDYANTVYVYVKLVQKNSDETYTDITSASGVAINNNGWITIGKITLKMGTPSYNADNQIKANQVTDNGVKRDATPADTLYYNNLEGRKTQILTSLANV